MAAALVQGLVFLCLAAGAASSCSCDCEALHEEVARLEATVRALRGHASQLAVANPHAGPSRLSVEEDGSKEEASASQAADSPIVKVEHTSDPEPDPDIAVEAARTRRTASSAEDSACDQEFLELKTDDDVKPLFGCHTLQRVMVTEDVSTLSALKTLESATELSIVGATKLTSLAGLSKLREVGSLVIRSNPLLECLCSLESLQTARRIELASNFKLKKIMKGGKKTSLHTVEEDLTITSNLKLKTLVGLENLVSVQTLMIQNADLMPTLKGLGSLARVKDLTLSRNDDLESLFGLANLSKVEGEFFIDFNQKLLTFSGLQTLQTVGQLTVVTNSALESLAGLESLTSVGSMVLRNNGLQSLNGLENLVSVEGGVDIEDNEQLLSLSALQDLQQTGDKFRVTSNGALESLGLESLMSVGGDLTLSGNQKLLSLSSFSRLQTVNGRLFLGTNDPLTSMAGLETLTSVGSMEVVSQQRLLSFSGLENLQTVEGDMRVHSNRLLKSFAGLEGLRSVGGSLLIESNSDLRSLHGLQSLRTARQLSVHKNGMMESLFGLGNLTSVGRDLIVQENAALFSLEGLENLESVGLLHIHADNTALRWLFPGLQSLAVAYRGIIIEHCKLSSLHGLGALYRAAELRVQCGSTDSPMQFLGGPCAAGAQIGSVTIDEAVWPQCTTLHEREALVSAVSSMERSSIPEQQCKNRELIETITCVKGQVCSFSIANFSIDGQEGIPGSVFVSGLTTGCGVCPDNHLQSRIRAGGQVDFGDALRDEEAGLHSICLCGLSGEVGPVGQLVLRGPLHSGVTVCSRGHNCTLRLSGALERTDHVVLTSGSCDTLNPDLGFAAEWTAENEYLLHDPGRWYAAPPNHYQVCWRASCPEGESACPGDSHYFHVGQVNLLGPYPNNYMVVLGESLAAANIGLGVLDGDHMRVMLTCGQADEAGVEVLQASSSGEWYRFGAVTEGRTRAGSHHLCWCQEREGINGVSCQDERGFMAQSGDVQILCPAGQELVEDSGHCALCPAGKQQPDPGVGPCADCPAGHSSLGGKSGCLPCPEGSFAEQMGSSSCVPCKGWESSNAEATGCDANPQMLVLLALFPLFVGALCALLGCSIRRQLSVVDVSLDEDRTIITIWGSHGLSNWGRVSFPVTLRNTGHPGLDSPSVPFRASVKDATRLELLTQQGTSIRNRLDSSKGILMVPSPYDFYHQGWPAPMIVSVPGLLIVVVALGALVVAADMAAEAFLAATAVGLACAAASVAVRVRPPATPLTRYLLKFAKKLAKQGSIQRCEKGPGRALAVGKLHELLENFHDFIRDRTAYYLASNILVPLTKPAKVSYAELVGPGDVEWFVSHFWGTAYSHFCAALQKHAETVCGNRDWRKLHYWVCFCSNNQHNIGDELGSGWPESSFYLTLRSGHCRGTCMVLDDKALPLTRIWCIFELLQTVRLKRSDDHFQGLLLCTASGVLNTGSGSVEVAMALATKVADMDLGTAQATSEEDAKNIRSEVVREMGSFSALNHFTCHEVYDMLAHAQSNANQRFAGVLAHLQENMEEPGLQSA